jgi:[pyruvate, water dikinase]-phosphate phosphotransferase / [pyruvate, water dikinase] kinase
MALPVPPQLDQFSTDCQHAMNKSDTRYFHMHLVSDATGETLNTVARAATAQYPGFHPIEHIYALVRTPKQLTKVLDGIGREPGIVLFTLIDNTLRHQLERHCETVGVPCISILDPVISSLAQYLNAATSPQIGGQHALDAHYFKRIDALNFTMTHDDGQGLSDINEADVVLLGISRTSKTPTCIYLAQRGIRAANIPIVPSLPVPQEIYALTKPMIVGLVASAERIAQIRRHRLLTLKESRETAYADARSITDELVFMKSLCAKLDCPMIDVTRRSVEETAAAVQNFLTDRALSRSSEQSP